MNKHSDGVIAFYATNGVVSQELFLVVVELLMDIPFHTNYIIFLIWFVIKIICFFLYTLLTLCYMLVKSSKSEIRRLRWRI